MGLFKGYMKAGPNGPEFDNEKNDSCFIGDFYNTFDRGYMDDDGYVFYVGRSDDVIISAGYRIGLEFDSHNGIVKTDFHLSS